MTKLFDTTRIPDDAAYWDALAERVAARAARATRERGIDWVMRSRASWLAASLILAGALAFLMLPAQTAPDANLNSEWVEALAPADDLGRAIISRNGPPALGALLLAGQEILR